MSEPVDPRAQTVRALLGWPTPPANDPTPVQVAPVSGKRTKKRTLRWFVALLVLLGLLGCDGKQGIVLWHAYNGVERDALAASVARWNAEHPDRAVELVGVPFASFGDKLTSAIPGGNGPDLFIYSQDRIGDWADAGVIEPIEFWVDDAGAARFTDVSLESMAYRGSLWGLPLTLKSLVMFYRTDLVPTPPRTTDELFAMVPALAQRGAYPMAYTNANLYWHAAWVFGYGGEIIDDAGKLAIATPAAASALAFARSLVQQRVVPAQAEGPQVATLFNEGKAAMAINGPWFTADIAQGVPWKVAPLPIVSATGKPAAPFLGAEGILMSSRARDKDAAFAVMAALTSDVAAIERARIAKQVVPNPGAYHDPAVASDPTTQAFRAQIEHSVTMPKGAAMRMIWTPYKTALGEVLAGRAEPADQLRAVEREVSGYLNGGNP